MAFTLRSSSERLPYALRYDHRTGSIRRDLSNGQDSPPPEPRESQHRRSYSLPDTLDAIPKRKRTLSGSHLQRQVPKTALDDALIGLSTSQSESDKITEQIIIPLPQRPSLVPIGSPLPCPPLSPLPLSALPPPATLSNPVDAPPITESSLPTRPPAHKSSALTTGQETPRLLLTRPSKPALPNATGGVQGSSSEAGSMLLDVVVLTDTLDVQTKAESNSSNTALDGRRTRGLMATLASRASLPILRTSQSLPDRLRPPKRPLLPPTQPLQHPSVTLLRQTAPPTPMNNTPPRFASPDSRFLSSARGLASGVWSKSREDEENNMIEIPRFKRRELNLAMVRRKGSHAAVVYALLWIFWLTNGLASLFFDANVIYMTVQCAVHPSLDTNARQLWIAAACTYCVCWAISIFVVWLGWEVGYEFYRRWRLLRPTIEPIYFSLPASVHLSLLSYQHFCFFLHIRLSPLRTPHALDIIPETAHALAQLIPGLIPLLPRAAIALVLIIGCWSAEGIVQTPFGGVDHTSERDHNFFRSDAIGELTPYAKGVLLAFVAWIGIRIVVTITSATILSAFSRSPFRRSHRTPRRAGSQSSLPQRDPSMTLSPAKSWREENEINWAWRDRTRSRIQDAFELCMIRRGGTGPRSIRSVRVQPSPTPASRTQPPTVDLEMVVAHSNASASVVVPDPGPSRSRPDPALNIDPPRLGPFTQSSSRLSGSRSTSMTTETDVFYTPAEEGPVPPHSILPTTVSEAGLTLPLPSPSHPGRFSEESTDGETTNDLTTLLPDDPSSQPRPRSVSVTASAEEQIPASSTPRARSTSISVFQQSLAAAAIGSSGGSLVKRARSGTVLSRDSGYSRIETQELDISSEEEDAAKRKRWPHTSPTALKRRPRRTSYPVARHIDTIEEKRHVTV